MDSTPSTALPHAEYERFESMREYEVMFDKLVPTTQRVIRIFDRSLSPYSPGMVPTPPDPRFVS